MADLDLQQRIHQEALRVYHRYALEVVEALGFCPWAAQARAQGRVRPLVILDSAPEPAQVAATAAQVSGDENTDIGLLLFPLFNVDRPQFQRFTAEVRRHDEAAHGRGQTPMAMADFHPQAAPNLQSAERLVPFIRRSPDPTIQLVRHRALMQVRMTENQGTSFVDPQQLATAALDQLGSSVEPLHNRIARANLRTVQEWGVTEVSRIVEAIHQDRHESYARLGLPVACWRQ